MNSGGHQSDLFPFRFNLGSMLGSGLASGRVSRHESATSTGVNPDPYTIAATVALLRYPLVSFFFSIGRFYCARS
ncbi:hypothetical protein Hanom_Chr16g01481271 [Helianthus anomalus]